MHSFKSILQKFASKGEKTGWTYIEIPADIAQKLKTDNKKSFRVKGKLDTHTISGIALIPMGGGSFIMALNAAIRKKIAKKKGAMLKVQLEEDKKPYVINKGFMECLSDEPSAKTFFQKLPRSHQNYFSKWIESTKTEITRTKRIAQAVTALARQQGFGEMLRAIKKEKDELNQ